DAALRERQINIQILLARRPVRPKLAAGGKLVGIGHVEDFAIRHQAAGGDKFDQAVRERFGVDLNLRNAVVGELRSSKAEMDQVFEIEVLSLKMLGRKKHPLGPNDSG